MQTSIEHHVEEAAVKAGGILRSRYSLWALGAISFFESALPVPVLTDPFLIAHILANRTKALQAVVVTTVTSVLGGVFAYIVALAFYEHIAAPYLHGALETEFLHIVERFKEGTFLITLIGAITPIPYTLVAMAAGFVKANFMVFIIASVAGRILRYGIVGWLTYRFGQSALAMARRQIIFASLVLFVAALLFFFVR